MNSRVNHLKKKKKKDHLTLWGGSNHLIAVRVLFQVLLNVEHYELKSSWINVATKWFGSHFSAILSWCSLLNSNAIPVLSSCTKRRSFGQEKCEACQSHSYEIYKTATSQQEAVLGALRNCHGSLVLASMSYIVNYIGPSFFINLHIVLKDYQTCSIWLLMIPGSFWCTPKNAIKVSAVLPTEFGHMRAEFFPLCSLVCCVWRLTSWSNQALAGQSNQCSAYLGRLGNPTVRSEKLLMRTEDESFFSGLIWHSSSLLCWVKWWHMETAPLSFPRWLALFTFIRSDTLRKSLLQSRITKWWE